MHLLLAAETATNAGAAAEEGLLLVAGLGVAAFVVGHATRRWVSEVIVFIAIGILIGPEALGVVSTDTLASLDPVIAIALGAIVFGIGERLELPVLRQLTATMTPMAVLENLLTFVLAMVGLIAVGLPVDYAYLLAAIALSTSPTTLVAVIGTRQARGRFTDHLLSLTAVNNLVSAILYGLGLPVIIAARSSTGAGQGVAAFAQLVVFSLVIGGVAAFALRRFMDTVHRPGERLLFVLVVLLGTVAVSRLAGAPVVISTLIAGALLANDPRDTRPLFGALRTLEAPIFLVFFVVAGAGVHLDELASVGLPGVVYVLARTIGKVAGGWGGAELTRKGRRSGWGPWIGAGLSPFAGMAIGLAAFTIEQANEAGLADLGTQVSAIVLGSVVIFELIGPLAVGRALDRTGESGADADGGAEADAADAPHLIRHILVPLSSPGMARRKASQIVDLASSTGATLTGLHVVRGDRQPDPDSVPPALRFLELVAQTRDVPFNPEVVVADSVVDAIVDTARALDVDLVVLGEPYYQALDRGGGRRIVHEVARRVAPDARVLVIPTMEGEAEETRPPTPESGARPVWMPVRSESGTGPGEGRA